MQLTDILYRKIEDQKLWEKELILERNDYLKISGSADTHLYYIVEGSLRVFVSDETEEHSIRFGYKHNFITALDSFITEMPSDLYIQALKKTSVKVLSKTTYYNFIKSTKKTLEIWEQLLGQLIVQQMERERDILTTSPLKRYQRVLQRSPQLFQEVPHKYIASYLRMTPETLSRLKKS